MRQGALPCQPAGSRLFSRHCAAHAGFSSPSRRGRPAGRADETIFRPPRRPRERAFQLYSVSTLQFFRTVARRPGAVTTPSPPRRHERQPWRRSARHAGLRHEVSAHCVAPTCLLLRPKRMRYTSPPRSMMRRHAVDTTRLAQHSALLGQHVTIAALADKCAARHRRDTSR